MRYLRLDLHVRGASMQQSPSVLTPAPILACVLFAHALDKKLGDALDVQGVGIIHHSAQPWLEHMDSKGYVHTSLVDRRGATLFDTGKNKEGSLANSSQPQPLTRLHYTLVLEVRYEMLAKEVCQRVLAMRLAGGTIERASARFFEDLPRALAHVGRGFWVQDATREIFGAHADTPELLRQCLLDLAQRDRGWVVPVNLGYSLLSNVQARQGARDGAPHAFAEHLLGVVRFVPLRHLLQERTSAVGTPARPEGLEVLQTLEPTPPHDLSPEDDDLEQALALLEMQARAPARASQGDRTATLLPLWTYGWVGEEFLTTNDPEVQPLLEP
jgi:hypothetical protein